VFAIDDHVDVRKEYDDITGETNNVTAENTTDRKWYERKFIARSIGPAQLARRLLGERRSSERACSRRSPPQLGAVFHSAGTHSDFPSRIIRSSSASVTTRPTRGRDEWELDKDKDTVHYMSFVTQETWAPQGSCLTQGGSCCAECD